MSGKGKTALVIIVIVIVVVIVAAGLRCGRNGDRDTIERVDEIRTDVIVSNGGDTAEVAVRIVGKEPFNDGKRQEVDGSLLRQLRSSVFQNEAALVDAMDSEAVGTVSSKVVDGTFTLYAQIDSLPDPEDGSYYEGWIVRPSSSRFFSAGRWQEINGTHANAYMSGIDLTAYDVYVVTLEADDGDASASQVMFYGKLPDASDES